MLNYPSAVLLPNRVKEKIGHQQAGVNDKKCREWFNDIMSGEESAQQKDAILREGQAQGSEDEEEEEAKVWKLMNKQCVFKHDKY